MLSHLYLNPAKYNKTQRKEKIKSLSVNNIIFKNGFNGFNYNYFRKDELFKKENKNNFKIFLESIKVPVYELLGYNIPTKFYLDCEMENITQDLFNKKDDLFLKFDKYLLKFLDDKFPQNSKNILYADSSRLKNDNYKISIHVIVNNLGFFNRNYLKKLILEFMDTLPKNIFSQNKKSFIDDSVYKGSQLMRIIYSHNLSKDSLLKPFIIINNKIVYKDIDFLVENYENSLCGKYTELNEEIIGNNEEIIGNNDYNQYPDDDKIIDNNDKYVEIPKWKINWINNNKYIKNIYKINNIENNFIDLKRINFNAYCNLCERIHNKDNAYCKINKNNIIFFCNRNPKGISIGSWYKNYNNNNIGNKLEEENLILKEKIKKLEEEIKKLKTIKNILPHKNTTHKNNIENKFEKYYEAGKLLINDNISEYNNIISQYWNDSNVSKLKNRCLRVYKLIEYMNNNNISNLNISLRSIFHIPNWKFDENLKNNIYI